MLVEVLSSCCLVDSFVVVLDELIHVVVASVVEVVDGKKVVSGVGKQKSLGTKASGRPDAK